MELRVLHRRGMSIRAIARELKMSRKTVRKYLREPELAPVYRTRAPRPSKRDPFKDYLKMRMAGAAPRRLPATVYLREIKERGYDGGITILRLWLADQYPQQPAPGIIRFGTPPGRQAQVDWTSIRRGRNKLSAFVGTPGYSRFSLCGCRSDSKGKFQLLERDRARACVRPQNATLQAPRAGMVMRGSGPNPAPELKVPGRTLVLPILINRSLFHAVSVFLHSPAHRWFKPICV